MNMENFFRLLKGEKSISNEGLSPSATQKEEADTADSGPPSNGVSEPKPIKILKPNAQDIDDDGGSTDYDSGDDKASQYGDAVSNMGTPKKESAMRELAQALELGKDEFSAVDSPVKLGEDSSVVTDVAQTLTSEASVEHIAFEKIEEIQRTENETRLEERSGTNALAVLESTNSGVSASSLVVTAGSSEHQSVLSEAQENAVEQESVEGEISLAQETLVVQDGQNSNSVALAAESSTVLPEANSVEKISAPLAVENTEALVESSAASAFVSELEAQLAAEISRMQNQVTIEALEDEEEGEWEEEAEEAEDVELSEEEDEETAAQRNEFMEALRKAVSDAQAGGTTEDSNPATTAPAVPAATSAALPPRGLGATGLPALPSRRPAAVVPAPAPPVQAEESPEEKERKQKLMNLRVQLLRAATRLGESMEHSAVSQVLYRLRLLEHALGSGRSSTNVDTEASKLAAELEGVEGGAEERLGLDCTVLVLGKAGSGKTSTIMNILGQNGEDSEKLEPTFKIVEREGIVKGIKLKFIDTPGLGTALEEQGQNSRILGAVKRHIQKKSPDVVLFFDRLDWISTSLNDLPLFRTITGTFGPALWFNSMLVLSRGASAPPDDSRGQPMSYDTFLAQRSFVLQQCIRQAANEVRLQVPTALVENHPICRTNRIGEKILPNGMAWRPQLLLLCFASLTLSSTNLLMRGPEGGNKKQEKKGLLGRIKELLGLKGAQQTLRFGPGGIRVLKPRHNTLPYMLSQLLQPKEPLRMAEDQNAMEEELDDDIMEEDLDWEEEDLPPFSRLSKADLEKLSPSQRREYFEELREREKIIKKQQFREQLRQRKEMRRMRPYMKEFEEEQKKRQKEEEEQEAKKPPQYLPEIALPPSFDAEAPSYRYRSLDNSQWLVRPLLGQQSWDHDPGFDTFSVERSVAINGSIPAAISGQISKDKNDGSLILEGNASKWYGDISNSTPVSTAGVDVQSVGKDTSYTMRVDHRVAHFGKARATAGLCLNAIAGILSFGLKLEERISLGRRGRIQGGVGVVSGKGDRAIGTQLELVVNHSKDYPLDRSSTTVGASLMEWQKDVSMGVNAATNFPVGTTSANARVNVNNRGAGQLSLRLSSNDHLSLALVGIIPVIRHFVGYRLLGGGQEGL